MKIIDTQKDYYDYLVGINGEDSHLVYDRKSYKYCLNDGHYRLVINGIAMEFVKKHGNIYYGKKLNDIGKPIKFSNFFLKFRLGNRIRHYLKYFETIFKVNNIDYKVNVASEKYYLEENEIIDKSVPIYIEEILFRPERGLNRKLITFYIYKNPNLDLLHLKIFPPELVWIEVSNFLSKQLTDKEIIVTENSDKNKILSHGFDIKQSFRHRK